MHIVFSESPGGDLGTFIRGGAAFVLPFKSLLMDKANVVYPHSQILFSHEKGFGIDAYYKCMKTWGQVNNTTRHQRPHSLWFCLHWMARKGWKRKVSEVLRWSLLPSVVWVEWLQEQLPSGRGPPSSISPLCWPMSCRAPLPRGGHWKSWLAHTWLRDLTSPKRCLSALRGDRFLGEG